MSTTRTVRVSTVASGDRILFLLKTRGPQTAGALGKHLRITSMGARQHLQTLARDGLVRHFDERRSVGRPKRHWQLTDQAQSRFPDMHADMTVEILGAARAVFGEQGIDRLIAERERQTLRKYRQALRGARTAAARVRGLAALRNHEGYMAEASPGADGSYMLTENHCPVCVAAAACQGLCRSELAIFHAVLRDCTVERIDHILAGARRCAYRITPRPVRRARG
jgi:predicted ArsR family transcriptional regulator